MNILNHLRTDFVRAALMLLLAVMTFPTVAWAKTADVQYLAANGESKMATSATKSTLTLAADGKGRVEVDLPKEKIFYWIADESQHFTITYLSNYDKGYRLNETDTITIASKNGEIISRVEFQLANGDVSYGELINSTVGTCHFTNGNASGSITDINAQSLMITNKGIEKQTTNMYIDTITVYYSSQFDPVQATETADQYLVTPGHEVCVKAIPNEGYHLASWSNGAEVNEEGKQTLTVSNTMTLTATFAPDTYDLSFVAAADLNIEGGNATVTVDDVAVTLTNGKLTGVKQGS